MTDECPVCGEPAQETMTVAMGDRWSDTAGIPPHSLFSRYQMLHVGGQTADGDIVVYLHATQRQSV